MSELKKYIRDVQDFPKEGVVFKDIGPLLANKFSAAIKELGSMIKWDQIDHVAGVESRGFIFAAALAQEYNKGFIPIRKKGKLPPPVYGHNYELEYGTDRLEISQDASLDNSKILLVDDVLATGGTLKAAQYLCGQSNLDVVEIAVLINLTFLNNFKDKPEITLRSLIEY